MLRIRSKVVKRDFRMSLAAAIRQLKLSNGLFVLARQAVNYVLS